VARVSFGAKMNQTVQALVEAASYPGPSLVLAYSPCIAHGYDLSQGCRQQRLAMETGAWPLFRFDPRRIERGLPPLQLDSGPPKLPLAEYLRGEARFTMVERQDRERFRRLAGAAQQQARQRFEVYRQLAGIALPAAETEEREAPGDQS
jgi:pyruvate-ferredoxin/flavodoxin oxidoreductase